MKSLWYAIRIQSATIVAQEIECDVVASLLDAAHPVFLGTRSDLQWLAVRHGKSLRVFSQSRAGRTLGRESFEPKVWAFALLTILLLVAAGCGSKHPDRLAVFPVSGQVTWNGQPLPNAFVVLHPKGAHDLRAVTARGQTDQSGNFRVTTYEAGDGAPVGDYAVTVAYHQLVATGGGYEPGPNVLPSKYAAPETTELTAHVAEGPNQLPPLTLVR
jgi:hypothetical protein